MLRSWNDRSSDQLGEFSLSRYEPMARLLSEEDLLFVRAQAGYRPEIGRKFVRDRRRIFRMYLRELTQDFHRLHASARAIVASLPAENAALVGVLVRQKCRFWYEMTLIEGQLAFAWTGLGTVDVAGLVNAVAGMQAEVSRLTAPVAA